MNSHVYMLARVRRRGTRGTHWGSRHGCGGCDDHLNGAYPDRRTGAGPSQEIGPTTMRALHSMRATPWLS
jgi:hypothetical protein